MKITFADKVSTIISSLPIINRIRAEDINEIKNVVNANDDAKQDNLIPGNNITIEDNVINATPVNNYSTNTTDIYSSSFINGTVLYEDSTGTATGNITLSDNKENYKFIEFYDTDGNMLGKIHVISGNQHVKLSQVYNTNGSNYYLCAIRAYINETSFSFNYNTRKLLTTSIANQTDSINIGYIIGYKY